MTVETSSGSYFWLFGNKFMTSKILINIFKHKISWGFDWSTQKPSTPSMFVFSNKFNIISSLHTRGNNMGKAVDKILYQLPRHGYFEVRVYNKNTVSQ